MEGTSNLGKHTQAAGPRTVDQRTEGQSEGGKIIVYRVLNTHWV
jgi:hypothetical protein